MKIKSITLLIFLIFAVQQNVFGADYYPELGMDPYYSSLNPAYINSDNESSETLLDFIKNKKNKKVKEVKKEKNKKINPDVKAEENPQLQQEEVSAEENNSNEEEQQPKKYIKAEEVNIDLNSLKDEPDNKKVLPGVLPDNSNQKQINSKKKERFVSSKYKDNADLAKQLDRDEKEKERMEEKIKNGEPLTFSIKNYWPFKRKAKAVKSEEVNTSNPDVEFSADYMEYFPDRFEVEAVGKARFELTKQNTVLTADKIVYNYDRNILRAHQNVVLLTNESRTEGDFIKLDLNKPEGWMEAPVTSTEGIKLSAKEAFIYSDKIEEYDGVAKILKNETLKFGATSFAGYVDQGNILSSNMKKKSEEPESGVYFLKADTIYVDSKQDHEVITVKNADLYLKNFKLASIPSAKIITNKNHSNIETNIPEFGTLNMLGAHIGPAVVLNVPGGSTLKVAPLLTYDKDKLGIGGLARFRNQYNMTEVAYGTSRDELLIRGRHKLAPGLMLNYSRLTNESEWFLGYRMPKYSAALNYTRNDYVKDLRLNFSQMFSAGAFIDKRPNQEWRDAEGRFRWMTQSYKSLYDYQNDEGDVSFGVGLVAQTMAGVYTTGDVSGLVRVGPAIKSQIGPWKQSLLYYQTAIAGDTPFDFDRYRYGRSNFVLIESLKINKYLSVGYLASLAMNREVKSDDLLQENRILLSLGPDYAKFTIGYDSIRQNTMFLLSMLVGTKDSDITFKKSVIKNPDNLGKSKTKKKKEKKKNYKKYVRETEKAERLQKKAQKANAL